MKLRRFAGIISSAAVLLQLFSVSVAAGASAEIGTAEPGDAAVLPEITELDGMRIIGDGVFQVNPMLGPLSDEEVLALCRDRGPAAQLMDGDAFFPCETLEEAVEFVRGQMVDRVETIRFSLPSEAEDWSLAYQPYLQSITVDTGRGNEGDYLRYHEGASFGYSLNHYNGKIHVTYELTYVTTKEQEAVVTEKVGQILAELSLDGKTDLEKVTAIYDWVCSHVRYDTEGLEHYNSLDYTAPDYPEQFREATIIFSAYDAVVNGKTVCQGFGSLTYRLLTEAGLQCKCITGGMHLWNIVRLGNRYYYLDTTWDAGREVYLYFLRGENNFTNHPQRDADHSNAAFLKRYPISMVDYGESYDEDDCGEGIGWSFTDGVLTVFGSGEIKDFSGVCPWDIYYDEVTEVVVGEGITRIGSNSFASYPVERVSLPESLLVIGEHAFDSCGLLSEITLPENLEQVQSYAFYECRRLASVHFSDSGHLKEIGHSAFWYCNLKNILLPEGVEYLGEGAFCNYSETAECIRYPSTLDQVSFLSFYLRTENLYINMSVGEWITKQHNSFSTPRAQHVFFLEEELLDYDLIIPSGVTRVGANSFEFMGGIRTVFIPNTVEEIETEAFYQCENLESVRFDENSALRIIGLNAFAGTALTEVDLPDSVERVRTSFIGCGRIRSFEFPKGIREIEGAFFSGWTALQEIRLPETVTSIPASCFNSCTDLETLTVPPTVTAIGANAFSGCSKLRDLHLPDGITAIQNWTFAHCYSLTELKIPEGVTWIGAYAFCRCEVLKGIALPDGLTTLKDHAFYLCSALEWIYLPASLTELPESVFEGCESLKDVYFGGTEEQWNQISIGESNWPLNTASIHFNCPGSGFSVTGKPETGTTFRVSVSTGFCEQATAYCAVYSSQGKLLRLKALPLTPGMVDTAVLDVRGGLSLKVMVLDRGNEGPACACTVFPL